MRVLQVDSGREWRGGQNQVRLLCGELVRVPSIEQRLVTRRGGDLAGRAAADGVAVRDVGWTVSLDPRALWGLYREINTFRPHVIHAHDSHALLLAFGARRLQHTWRGGPLPHVIGTRRVDFPIRPSSWWHRTHRIVAVSTAVKAVLVACGVDPARIAVVHSAIDLDEVRRVGPPLELRTRLQIAAGVPIAVNVGALVDQKDHRTLIRAAAIARPLRPELHWVIAGEGPLRPALEAEIRALGLADRVRLLGHVDRIPMLLREADLFVLSSRGEGLPNVVLEAIALEKPVVATRAGGTPEVVPDSCLVDIGDAEALARKVVEVLTHPASPFPLPEQFTARAMAQGVLAVYRSLL